MRAADTARHVSDIIGDPVRVESELKEQNLGKYESTPRDGEEFRQTYGLASSCFILQKYDGKLRITTRGVGHGLGLSQYTANEMANEGKDAAEILQYFFEGTEIREVAEIVTNSQDTE